VSQEGVPVWKKLTVALALLAVVAAGAVWLVRRGAPRSEVAYALAPVEWGEMSETVGATGAVEPLDVVAVGCPLAGQVVELYPGAEVNATVREGDPLLRLDDRLAREKLEQAEAVVRTAAADVARARAQHEGSELNLSWQTWRSDQLQKVARITPAEWKPKETVPEFELDKAKLEVKGAAATVRAAEARLAEAQAALRQARTGVDLTVVRVPSGPSTPNGPPPGGATYTVLERKVVLGQLVAPPASAQLFTLATDLGRMRVRALVSEDDVGRVAPGLPAKFSVYAYPEAGERFHGAVTEVRPMPVRQHGLVFYEALVGSDNSRDAVTGQWVLRPGMTASVTLLLRTRAETWKAPAAALEFEPADAERTEAAKAKLARWDGRADREAWRPVWTLGPDRKPWPVFVRVGGVGPDGRPGIADGRFTEALEWDPELEPKPVPGKPETYLQVITGSPAREGDRSRQPLIKVF
jgi:HlyD family secretion protein